MSAVLAFISFLFVSIGTGMPDLLRATYYLSSSPAHTEHDIKLGVFTKVRPANHLRTRCQFCEQSMRRT